MGIRFLENHKIRKFFAQLFIGIGIIIFLLFLVIAQAIDENVTAAAVWYFVKKLEDKV